MDETTSLSAVANSIARLENFRDAAHRAMPYVTGIEDPYVLSASRELQSAVATVQDTLRHLKNYSGPYQRSANTIVRIEELSADILSEIFQAWALTDQYTETKSSRGFLSPAFVAASVNRRWRALALELPSLWRTVEIRYYSLASVDSYVELMLARSKNCVLNSVKLRDVPIDKVKFEFGGELLVRLLAKTEAITISWSSTDSKPLKISHPVLSVFQAPLPNLKSLTFKSFGYRGSCHWVEGAKLLTLAPNLELVKLDFIEFNFIDIANHPLIKSISFSSNISVARLRSISSCPHLTCLELYADNIALAGPPLHFPQLQILTCKNSFLRAIDSPASVPHLHTLNWIHRGAAEEPFSHFLRGGPCTSLKTLSLAGSIFRNKANINSLLLTVFPAVPNLSSLEFRHVPDMTGFFDTWRDNRPALLDATPNLLILRIVESKIDANALAALVTFLARRREEQASLPTTTVVIHELYIQQIEYLSEEDCKLPSWMRPRLEQLVEHVTFDTEYKSLRHLLM